MSSRTSSWSLSISDILLLTQLLCLPNSTEISTCVSPSSRWREESTIASFKALIDLPRFNCMMAALQTRSVASRTLSVSFPV